MKYDISSFSLPLRKDLVSTEGSRTLVLVVVSSFSVLEKNKKMYFKLSFHYINNNDLTYIKFVQHICKEFYSKMTY